MLESWFASPVVFVFRAATYVNVVCGLGLLVLLPLLPESFGILLLPFYCLIYGVLPAWCFLGVAVCTRLYNRLPVKGHLKREIHWGLQAVGSFVLLIVLLSVFSAVIR